jgi:CRISPR-associated protein Cst2
MKINSLTLTYLSKVSFASLNGGDKEVDNINPIKKITLANGEELPYVSSQALRRALRDSGNGLGTFAIARTRQ